VTRLRTPTRKGSYSPFLRKEFSRKREHENLPLSF
jgi:hypothetical protein